MTNITFLLKISVNSQLERLWELIVLSLKKISFDLLTNSLNQFLKKSMKASLENLYVELGAWRVQKNYWVSDY